MQQRIGTRQSWCDLTASSRLKEAKCPPSGSPAMPRTLTAPTAANELQHFTNREKEQEVLRRLLDVPAGMLLPIVMFYGVGGSGKSWLLQKLRLELPANLPCARLDFDPTFGGVSYHTDQTGALAELRRQLGDRSY